MSETVDANDTLERAFQVIRTIVEVCDGKSLPDQNEVLLTIRDLLEEHDYQIDKLKSSCGSAQKSL